MNNYFREIKFKVRGGGVSLENDEKGMGGQSE